MKHHPDGNNPVIASTDLQSFKIFGKILIEAVLIIILPFVVISFMGSTARFLAKFEILNHGLGIQTSYILGQTGLNNILAFLIFTLGFGVLTVLLINKPGSDRNILEQNSSFVELFQLLDSKWIKIPNDASSLKKIWFILTHYFFVILILTVSILAIPFLFVYGNSVNLNSPIVGVLFIFFIMIPITISLMFRGKRQLLLLNITDSRLTLVVLGITFSSITFVAYFVFFTSFITDIFLNIAIYSMYALVICSSLISNYELNLKYEEVRKAPRLEYARSQLIPVLSTFPMALVFVAFGDGDIPKYIFVSLVCIAILLNLQASIKALNKLDPLIDKLNQQSTGSIPNNRAELTINKNIILLNNQAFFDLWLSSVQSNELTLLILKQPILSELMDVDSNIINIIGSLNLEVDLQTLLILYKKYDFSIIRFEVVENISLFDKQRVQLLLIELINPNFLFLQTISSFMEDKELYEFLTKIIDERISDGKTTYFSRYETTEENISTLLGPTVVDEKVKDRRNSEENSHLELSSDGVKNNNRRILTTGHESLDILIAISLIVVYIIGLNLVDTYSSTIDPDFIIILIPAYILHEFGHRFVARNLYGKNERFVLNPGMFSILLISSVFGFPILVPGGVTNNENTTKEETGIIAAVGPAVNLILGIISLSFVLFLSDHNTSILGVYNLLKLSAEFNIGMAIFNLLPFAFFDGKKTFDWNIFCWGILFSISTGIGIGMFILLGK